MVKSNESAIFNVCVIYLGQDQRDYAQAGEWCDKSARLGNSTAQSLIGLLHYSGSGVAQSDAQAYKWLTISTRQSDRRAQALTALEARMPAADRLPP